MMYATLLMPCLGQELQVSGPSTAALGSLQGAVLGCRSKKGFAEAAEKQAKRVAFYIYWNVKPDSGRTFLVPADFEELLPLEQSREAFAILDSDANGQLTPGELCRGVTQIYKCAPTPGPALLPSPMLYRVLDPAHEFPVGHVWVIHGH